MKRILITGATGNIGREVVHNLLKLDRESEIIVAARNIEGAKKRLTNPSGLAYRRFDFMDQDSFVGALKDIDLLFLLRPPNISQVDAVFFTPPSCRQE